MKRVVLNKEFLQRVLLELAGSLGNLGGIGWFGLDNSLSGIGWLISTPGGVGILLTGLARAAV